MNRRPDRRQTGFTLVEVLISTAIGTVIMGAVAAFMFATQSAAQASQVETALLGNANFALDRMVRAVESAQHGFLPLGENPATAYSESQRSLLAVSMDPSLDRDRDGWSDANNDRDWMDYDNDGVRDPGEPERIDEDPGHDFSNDGAPGLVGIDDDNDGLFDEPMEFDDPLKSEQDDDEDGWKNDDNANGADDDGDGSIDEDPKQEISDDHAPGIASVDDNFDGIVDDHPAHPGPDSKEGRRDDDEDGAWNEDWPDPVVFYLGATEVYAASGDATPHGEPRTLYERMPEAAAADGTDFTSRVIGTDVDGFSVQRMPTQPGATPLFRITLVVGDADGQAVTVSRTARLGARR